MLPQSHADAAVLKGLPPLHCSALSNDKGGFTGGFGSDSSGSMLSLSYRDVTAPLPSDKCWGCHISVRRLVCASSRCWRTLDWAEVCCWRYPRHGASCWDITCQKGGWVRVMGCTFNQRCTGLKIVIMCIRILSWVPNTVC
jgi:hypothetical protein